MSDTFADLLPHLLRFMHTYIGRGDDWYVLVAPVHHATDILDPHVCGTYTSEAVVKIALSYHFTPYV